MRLLQPKPRYDLSSAFLMNISVALKRAKLFILIKIVNKYTEYGIHTDDQPY